MQKPYHEKKTNMLQIYQQENDPWLPNLKHLPLTGVDRCGNRRLISSATRLLNSVPWQFRGRLRNFSKTKQLRLEYWRPSLKFSSHFTWKEASSVLLFYRKLAFLQHFQNFFVTYKQLLFCYLNFLTEMFCFHEIFVNKV